MSQKITAKNLSYSQNLPPFLARLRGEAQSNDGPDPILSARRRPVKPRSGSAEAEDAPTIIDEHGNVVQDVTVGVDGTVKGKPTAAPQEPGKDEGADNNEKSKGEEEDNKKPSATGTSTQQAERLASIGGVGKKRKVGKVIGGGGGDADEEEDNDEKTTALAKNSNKKKGGDDKDKKEKEKEKEGAEAKSKPKKKANKKIKLSFGDDEG